MRIQERCFLLGLCLLGGVALSTTADTEARITTTPDTNGENTVNVRPLRAEWRNNDTTEPRSAYPTKEADIKAATEAKKKLATDFKVKGEQRYQKPVVKDDDARRLVADLDGPTASSTLPASTTPLRPDDDASATTRPSAGAAAPDVTVPFLLRGEPMVSLRKPTPTSGPAAGSAPPKVTKETRGRALNISAPEPINSLNANITDLSDVSMDEDDKEVEGGEYVAFHNETTVNASSSALLPRVCVLENRTYSVGERIVRGCEERCVCAESGIADCKPLCILPYVRANREIRDPSCQKEPVPDQPCCARLSCTDSATEPDETCTLDNKTVARGERVEDGCAKVCICEAGGHLKCQPRCPPNETSALASQHDRCVELTDPRDSCCTITLCDVTLTDLEIKSENSTDLSVHLMDVKVLNSTAIKLKLSAKNPQNVTIEISQNNHVWTRQRSDKDGIITNLEPAHTYYVRVAEGSRAGPSIQVVLPAEVVKANISEKASDKSSCNYRGKSYKIGTEWYDGCVFFCTCAEGGKSECATIECPTDFGLDLLDPHCLDWETIPAVPKPPHCCPQEARCRNNGSCQYEGVTYNNWSKIPSNVTGCEKQCACEMGNVTCQSACKSVPALPPASLPCSPHQATLTHSPHNSCCLQWTCSQSSQESHAGLDHNIIPPGFSLAGFPSAPSSPNEVTIQVLEALDEYTVRLVFTVPQVLVGLHGRVELRYTSDTTNTDPSTWKVQVFAPPSDLIATPQLEFELGDLKPMTEYKVKITVKLNDLANSPSSKIYSVRTLEKREEVTTLPPQIPINAELRVTETNSTWVNVMWKKFTEYELQFIDGVQLWYKERDSKAYLTTPLIHRAVTNYIIENLKPSTTYEILISLIPFSGQATELISEKTIQVTTSVDPDPYSFDVKVEIKTIKSTDVEVAWSGVPYPEDKYVNIYRAIYQSDTGKEDTSTFKIAKRDSHTKTVISDLKPGTRYRLWLEIYLTNGRIKKSNVQDFVTKPGSLSQDNASQQTGKYASLPLYEADYYNPLVIVAIVASLAILSTLILLLMLMKRRTSSKADISPRKTSSAYDNPSYKTCEDAAAISNGRNKSATDHEMATINSNVKETA